MKNYLLVALTLFSASALSQVIEIPMVGEIKAESHQICGKNIDIQIRTMNENSLIIGLMNTKTHTWDFFRSAEPIADSMKYSKFIPVRFDSLSRTFIAEEKPDIEIIWGNALNEKKQVKYSLALGPHVYECGLLQKWPNEAADLLYGEPK